MLQQQFSRWIFTKGISSPTCRRKANFIVGTLTIFLVGLLLTAQQRKLQSPFPQKKGSGERI
jgi:hypothetical protein